MRKAIVLGGTTDHIYLIHLLKSKNFHVILIDYLDEPPAKKYADKFIQKSITDKELILSIGKKEQIDLIVATSIDQALETSAYVSENLGLPCHISYETALNLTNKKHMKEKMLENNLPTSRFKLLTKKEDLLQLEQLTFPLVIKPVDANSSKGVFKTHDVNEAICRYEESFKFSRTGEVLIEEYIEGKELSIDVFIENNKANVLMISENIKSKLNIESFTITESVYDHLLETKLKNKIEGIATQIASAFKINNAPLLLQCIYNESDNTINIIEFSSRIGGGSKYFYINTIKNIDIMSAFINVILNENNIDISCETTNYRFAKILYLYCREGVISKYLNFEQEKENGTIVEYFIYKNKGTKIVDSSKSTDRCAGVFIASNDQKKLKGKEEKCKLNLLVLNEQGDNILHYI